MANKAPRPANQGSAGTPKIRPAKPSPHTGNKSANNATPTTPQDKRGYRTEGKGGTGTTSGKPRPFKA